MLDLARSRPGPGGFFPPARWPSACDLVDDATLRAVFPQASDVVRTPREEAVAVPPGRAGGAEGSPGPPTIAVPERTCEVRFALPGAPADTADPDASGALVRAEVVAAGDPRAVADAGPVGGAGDRVQIRAGGRCAVDASSSECFKGPLRFRITVTPPTAEGALVYVVGGAGGSSLGGRTVTLGATDVDGRARLVRDEVLPRLDDAVLARVP